MLVQCHALEDPPQHVGGDGLSVAGGQGEVEALEERIERISKHRSRQSNPPAPLEHVRLEETAIEKGNRTKAAGELAAFRKGTIQSPEKERVEQVALQRAMLPETPIHRFAQEPRLSAEPALGFDKVQKENPGELQQGERVPVRQRDPRGHRRHDVVQGPAESAEEALIGPTARQRLYLKQDL